MTRPFDAFVMLAGMRTGSNALEASLNALPDITCYGEVYNPTFVGHHNQHTLFGYDMRRREADPLGLLDVMVAQTEGLAGFRLFHDHDDRVLSHVLATPRIAKILLTRNPLESYISRKIAAETGQWRLTDMKNAKTARVAFVEAEFRQVLDAQSGFQKRLERGLQITGQTAFKLTYEDINDPEILNGLARFLGSAAPEARPASKLKKQNPGGLKAKVRNYDEMLRSLSGFDRFGLDAAPDFEPSRAPGVPTYVAHPEAGLLFMPIAGVDAGPVLSWMASLGGVGCDGLLTDMNQKALRQWMRSHPGFQSFTVLNHPVARAFAAFRALLAHGDDDRGPDIRRILRERYDVPLPQASADQPGSDHDYRAGFLGFLAFLKGNLAGQTSLRVEAHWASQLATVQGFARVVPPHHLLHAGDLDRSLPNLAQSVGIGAAPFARPDEMAGPITLSAVYDAAVEKAVHDVYRRDYVHLGFSDWAPQG